MPEPSPERPTGPASAALAFRLTVGFAGHRSVKDEDNIVATSYPGHEEINVHLQIGGDGALRSVRARRWGQIRRRSHCYLTFGGDMHAEQRFGDLIIPSRFTVGWRYGTPDYDPFFQAHIRATQPQPSHP